MDYYSIASVLIVLSSIFGYINVRFLKLPTTIGLMIITIVYTLILIIIGQFNDALLTQEKELILNIDFETVLLDVMLSFLLFAGALHTNFEQLKVLIGQKVITERDIRFFIGYSGWSPSNAYDTFVSGALDKQSQQVMPDEAGTSCN